MGLLALASYGARLSDAETPDDVLYLWSTFAGALIQYGIMLVLDPRDRAGPRRSPLLALERPAAIGPRREARRGCVRGSSSRQLPS